MQVVNLNLAKKTNKWQSIEFIVKNLINQFSFFLPSNYFNVEKENVIFGICRKKLYCVPEIRFFSSSKINSCHKIAIFYKYEIDSIFVLCNWILSPVLIHAKYVRKEKVNINKSSNLTGWFFSWNYLKWEWLKSAAWITHVQQSIRSFHFIDIS